MFGMRLLAIVVAFAATWPTLAPAQHATVTVLHQSFTRPAICGPEGFVFLTTPQGPLMPPDRADPAHGELFDLVLARRRFGAAHREESRVPRLQPFSSSDLELHCHRRVVIVTEIFISAHSAGVALDWPQGAPEAGLIAHFTNTPVSRPATLLTSLASTRSFVFPAATSRRLQAADLGRLKKFDEQVGYGLGTIVAMPPDLEVWPASLIAARSNGGEPVRIGVDRQRRPDVVALLGGDNYLPTVQDNVPLEIAGTSGTLAYVTAAPLSSFRHVQFAYERGRAGHTQEVVGLAECGVSERVGGPIVRCDPVFQLALPWAQPAERWPERKVVMAMHAGRAVVGDSLGALRDQTCVRFVEVPASNTPVEAESCDALVDGRIQEIVVLSADRAALLVSAPGDPHRTDGVHRVLLVTRPGR